MALAYTAPTWEDGSGTGISASQLQALCNCVEGLVQGSDKAVHNITFSGSTMTLTFADGSQETAATSVKGVSSITKTGSSQTDPVVDTYTITYSDGTTSTFQITNGAKGDTGATPVITVSATADAIASLNPTVEVTKTGTDEAPHFSMAFSGLKGQTGPQGNDGYSPAVTITNIPGGHRVNITDSTHPTGQNFDVLNGDGAGDMLAQDYDPTSEVANAGGIPSYAMKVDGSNAASEVKFAGAFTIGTRHTQYPTVGTNSVAIGDFTVASAENAFVCGDSCKATASNSFAVGDFSEANGAWAFAAGRGAKANAVRTIAMGASATAGYAGQVVLGEHNDNQYNTIFEIGNGTDSSHKSNALELYANGNLNVMGQILRNGAPEYLENDSVTLSTSGTTTVTFTNAAITTDSVIDCYCTQFGLNPDDITVSSGSCVVTMPQVDTAVTVGVRIYLK